MNSHPQSYCRSFGVLTDQGEARFSNLKFMARSYDRSEGLVGGQDIKTLRMEYLRCARQSCSRTTFSLPSLYVYMPHVLFQGLLTCTLTD